MKFSEKLVILRKQYQFSQEQLADMLDVSRQSVSKWESGQTYPEMDKLLSMCKIFKCSLDDLTNDEITVEEILNKKKNNVSNVVYEILELISKSFAMFRSMNFKQACYCIFELGILFIILLLFRVPVEYVIHLGNRVFENFGSTGFVLLSSIWNFIWSMMYFVLALVIFVFIYKSRYLDRYEEKRLEIVIENKTPDIVKEVKDVSFSKEKSSKERSYAIFNVLGNIVMFCVKFLIACMGIPFIISLIALFAFLIIDIVLLIKGVFYFGILLAIVACILLNYLVLEFIFFVLFQKNLNVKKFFICFIVGLVGIGISIGISFFEITNTQYIDQAPKVEKKEVTEEYMMNEDTILYYGYYDNVSWKVDNQLQDKVMVSATYYPEYTEFTFNEHNHQIDWYLFEKDSNFYSLTNMIIEDLKKKQVYHYSKLISVSIVITTSETNIQLLQERYQQKQELEEQEHLRDYYESKLHELETSYQDLQQENSNLQVEKENLQIEKDKLQQEFEDLEAKLVAFKEQFNTLFQENNE